MSLKWRLVGLFFAMTGLSLLLFRVGERGRYALAGLMVDPWVGILALMLPGAAVFVFASKLSAQLENLREAAARLSRGSFDKVYFPDSSDELGELADELNRLSKHNENMIKQAVQEARRLEALLKGMQEGVVALDHVGRIMLLNLAAERIFGCGFEDVKQKYFLEIVDNPGLDQLVTEVLRGGSTGILEMNLGSAHLQIQVSPILTEEGPPQGAVVVGHDVTELRRLEQLRTEFVANVSHELRTPLTSIKGFAETLLDGAAEVPELRKRFLKIIEAETLRLQRLIEDLLTLSHLENRDVRRPGGASYIEKAFEKIQPVIQQYAEAKGIEVRVNFQASLPAIALGEDLLSQVMLNLMENAVKYTSAGYVWLAAQVGIGEVRIDVGDTGCGIPEENLPRIFERFYRVDKARSREQGGTGLGLSIVKHIVDGSGGQITVRSRVGEGSVFTCSLPRALEAPGG